jgi:hypothetical protein
MPQKICRRRPAPAVDQHLSVNVSSDLIDMVDEEALRMSAEEAGARVTRTRAVVSLILDGLAARRARREADRSNRND